jgi:hypothetical protein
VAERKLDDEACALPDPTLDAGCPADSLDMVHEADQPEPCARSAPPTPRSHRQVQDAIGRLAGPE